MHMFLFIHGSSFTFWFCHRYFITQMPKFHSPIPNITWPFRLGLGHGRCSVYGYNMVFLPHRETFLVSFVKIAICFFFHCRILCNWEDVDWNHIITLFFKTFQEYLKYGVNRCNNCNVYLFWNVVDYFPWCNKKESGSRHAHRWDVAADILACIIDYL